MASSAVQTWQNALKIRKVILKKLEDLKSEAAGDGEAARFAAIEGALSEFRLQCVQTIFFDFRFAHEKKAEFMLWQLHTFLNQEFRDAVGRLRTPQRAVQRHKVEKKYVDFLKTSQYFYRGFVQRLAARYDLPDLARVAKGINAESLPAADRIDAADSHDRILRLCYDALIHMGDLARYRAQATPKKNQRQGGEMSLTYFNLAQELLPDCGNAHHQMGVIAVESKNHLDVVYHFYRALVVKEAHPYATKNLALEFKSLLRPSGSGGNRHNSPPDAKAAFVSWFVRLHAHFYQGQVFPQHSELEEEVIHRTELALKSQEMEEELMKMALINLSAYQVASSRVNAEWTMTGSMFCQFTLRLNVRFVLTFSRILFDELKEVLQRVAFVATSSEERLDVRQHKWHGKITGPIRNLLPLFRVYLSWLYYNLADISNYQSHLEPFAEDMCLSLGKCLLSLNKVFPENDVGVFPYLLAEDVTTIGLVALDNPALPAGCRLHFNELDGRNAARKVRFDQLGIDRSGIDQTALSELESVSRIAEILLYGRAMVARPEFSLSQSLPQPTSGAPEISAPSQEQASRGAGDQSRSPHGDINVSGYMENLHASPMASVHTKHSASNSQTFQEAQAPLDAEYDTDMMDLVKDFLTPPEVPSARSTQKREDTSYGMHSSTANEIFGDIAPSQPAPHSAASKEFTNLPWEYFLNTPAGNGEETDKNHTGSSSGFGHPLTGSTRGSKVSEASFTIQGLNILDDPFANALRQQYKSESRSAVPALPRRMSQDLRTSEPLGGSSIAAMVARTSPPGPPTSENAYEQYQRLEGNHQASLQPRPESGQSRGRLASTWGAAPGSAGTLQSAYPQYSANRASYAYSHENSYRLHEQPQSNQVAPGTMSSLAFSHPSSIYQSTPCNGRFYDGTTAFGRGNMTGKDSPTHYSNMIKQSGAYDYSQAYEQRALYSAFDDEEQPPRLPEPAQPS